MSGAARRIWRRAKPVLPLGLRGLLEPAARRAGGRPLLGLPRTERTVVLAPHPDDESLGCGGTLALLTERGTSVTVCFCSDGEALASRPAGAHMGELRRREALAACRTLGLVTTPRFLGRPDGRLGETTAELASDLGSLLAAPSPDLVMLPWPFDAHPDHRATALALARVDLPKGVEVWMYEVWSPLPANRLVDISSVVDLKRSAIEAHAADPQLADAVLSLNRYRAGAGLVGGHHAEAFLALPAADLATIL